MTDRKVIYLDDAIDALAYFTEKSPTGRTAQEVVKDLPPAQSEPHEIGYSECANSTLKMWIDNVLTDGEYSHIMDKLNAYWAERREE